MAFRTLAQRFNHISKTTNSCVPAIYNSQSIFASPFSPAILTQIFAQNPANIIFRREFHNVPDSEENVFFRRFFHKQSEKKVESSPMLIREKVMKKLKLLNFSKDRLRLDGLIPPAQLEPPEEISVEDAKKILKVSQLEMLKTSLRQIPKNCISYSEFLEICVQHSSPDQGFAFSKLLDDSGSVIVLGNFVFLRPEQVTKAIGGVIPLATPNPNDPLRKELAEMEKAKAEIDKEAVTLVRMELWAGLGYLVVQTVGFMRLTFWELSWDVMEPICFYVTSFYVLAGYSFFMKTSREPCFEGFFESRFKTKQKKLMKKRNFDVQRFNELRRTCYPFASEPPLPGAGGHSVNGSDKSLVSAARH